jgi:hypothetical protein
MLASTRFGNNPSFLHAQSQQCLTERVIDFVRPGMIEILPFQPNLCTPKLFTESSGMIKGRGTTNKTMEKVIEFCLKVRILPRPVVLDNQLIQGAR